MEIVCCLIDFFFEVSLYTLINVVNFVEMHLNFIIIIVWQLNNHLSMNDSEITEFHSAA